MAGARALLPDPAAFGAAAEREPDEHEAGDGGEALRHGLNDIRALPQARGRCQGALAIRARDLLRPHSEEPAKA